MDNPNLPFPHSPGSCDKKPKAGQFYNSGCEISQCTNAQTGQYYTGPAPEGTISCPVATCTNTLHVGQYYTTSGGTNPTGCESEGLRTKHFFFVTFCYFNLRLAYHTIHKFIHMIYATKHTRRQSSFALRCSANILD